MSSNAPQLNVLPALRRIHAYMNKLLKEWISNPHADHLVRFQLEGIHPLSPATGDKVAIQIVSSLPCFSPGTEESQLCSTTPARTWKLYCWYQDSAGIRYFPISTYTEPSSVSRDKIRPWRPRQRLRGILAALNSVIVDYQASSIDASDPSYLNKERSQIEATSLPRNLGSTTTCVSCDGPVQVSSVDVDGQAPNTCFTCRLILRNTSTLKSRCLSEPVF
ncbi:hypothetical protein CPB85DRAFT_1437628 [Mucidula mucida]|nr:hypothetical protein CPB85DRAFT_1437628 [Mucidula mucida]